VRKDLKKASEFINSAKALLQKASANDKIPEEIRNKAVQIKVVLESSISDLEDLRAYK
jgi:uncharacterized protein (UPF0147 family)